MWDALRLDVRHSFRSLRRAPTFSLIVILTLTVAVGATTAVGSLLNALVLRKPAVPNPEQLVAVSALDPLENVSGWLYADTFKAYLGTQRSFAQMSMYAGGRLVHVEARSGAFEASTETVSPTYFDLVGARLSAGRFFSDADDAAVVISEGFRRRLFGSGSGVGQTITVNAVPTTVIGVTADGFQGLQHGGPPDIIQPFALIPGDRPRPLRSSSVVGRLATGVSIDAARDELRARWPRIQSATLPSALPERDREALLRQRPEVAPLETAYWAVSSRYGTTLVVLQGLVAMLLAVAAANLAGLTLARSLTRRHQFAVRLALGGSAARVCWQLLLDGILLSAVAFAGAVPLAWAIVQAVRESLVAGLFTSSRWFPDVAPDAGVLAATALLTLVIGLAMGVVAAWQSVTVRVDQCLRRGRGSIESFGRFGRGLLVAQVALSMTCLVGAGLFTATLARLRANDTSLQSQRIVFTRAYREPGDQALLPPEYYRALVADLGHMPGAEAAALSVYYPTYFHTSGPLPTEHYTRADGAAAPEIAVLPERVSPGFFDLFRLPRLQGRDISWDDGPATPAVALLSASVARVLFPAGDAVGRYIRLAGPERRDIEVIGVVADAPYGRLDDPRPFVVFRPMLQDLARSQFPMAYVRASSGDLATVHDGYRRVIKALGHRLLRDFMTTSEYVDNALLRQRFTAGLATFVAAITILLACMGVYGLLAYSVAARVREIGVRLALGAARGTVIWMIMRDGLAIAVPGVLVGTACAWSAARLVRAQLYGIAPGDPRMLLIAAAVSLATVLAASWLPALRASRVAPVEALREE
ncbi:Macrolide export ATP-binding/permease protein MacB [Luteitalea pratensis]|uniref:Macrolide export ATP-binding/permease protein MacB n=1 Tax=Luteitalea pratensis TaxID=1855912 RepID=A0A143PR02_LUTPR|nr:ABC transporter permease [Luteitalea pratensis]AMY10861.1 Macrolide export ATP-binding/permease protein MacB [Luteitalea pratensis]